MTKNRSVGSLVGQEMIYRKSLSDLFGSQRISCSLKHLNMLLPPFHSNCSGLADGAHITSTGLTFTYEDDPHALAMIYSHISLRAHDHGVNKVLSNSISNTWRILV